MDLALIILADGLVQGLLLFMLSAGLTLIFSMMGVLNFAHASFYMLGAYFGHQIGQWMGYWPALILAPVAVGLIGAAVERHGLRRVYSQGHVAELIFTFGLAIVLEQMVQLIWGNDHVDFQAPEVLHQTAFSLGAGAFPVHKLFLVGVALVVFGALYALLKATRTGLIVQAALTHSQMVQCLGHNVPRVFMGVFGVGSALAGLAGVIVGPWLGTFPGMAYALGAIVFVVIVVGGLGSLAGALVASLAIGLATTAAKSVSLDVAGALTWAGLAPATPLSQSIWRDLWTLSLTQLAELLPYLFMVLVLIIRPQGLMGRRA